MKYLVKADQFFWEEKFLDSLVQLESASKYVNLFLNSRGTERKLDKLAKSIGSRIQGMTYLSEALGMSWQKRRRSLNKALEAFNLEIKFAKSSGEEVSSLLAYSRALLAEGLQWSDQAKKEHEKESFKAKNSLMTGRFILRQAGFLNNKARMYVDDIDEALDDLTKDRILGRAKKYETSGNNSFENNEFKLAKNFFEKATRFYNRASQLADSTQGRRKLLAKKAMTEAFIIESDASTNLKVENDPWEASLEFDEALVSTEKALALLGAFVQSAERTEMEAIKDYYLSMAKLSKGTYFFDRESYKEALQNYTKALEAIKKALKGAKEVKNKRIIKVSERSIADLNAYVEMVSVLLE